MTGFFGEYDIAGAADDPWAMDPGTYEGAVSKVEVLAGEKDRKDDDGNPVKVPYKGLQVTFSTANDGDYQHYFSLPMPHDSAKAVRMKRSSLKAFLSGLEVPESRMNTIQPDDLIGIKCVFTIKKNNAGYWNIEVHLPTGTPVQKGEQDFSEFEKAAGKDTANADFGL